MIAELLLHAHQRHARAAHAGDLEPPQELGELHRSQLAVELLDRLVEVGERHDEGHALVVDIHEHGELGHDHRTKRLGGMIDLGLGEGHEAPVVAPGVVEDPDERAHLGIEHLHVGRAHLDPALEAAARQQLGADRLRRVLDVVVVGEDVLGLRIAASLDPRSGIGRIVRHHQDGSTVEAMDQQADLFVDREAERAGRPHHALVAQPSFGRREQRGEDRGIVLRGEAAEIAGAVVVTLEMGAIDLRGDAAHHLAGAPRQEEAHLDMLEQRVLARREGFHALEVERRDVALVAGIEAPGQRDEGLQVGLRVDRTDDDVERSHGRLTLPGRPAGRC